MDAIKLNKNYFAMWNYRLIKILLVDYLYVGQNEHTPLLTMKQSKSYSTETSLTLTLVKWPGNRQHDEPQILRKILAKIFVRGMPVIGAGLILIRVYTSKKTVQKKFGTWFSFMFPDSCKCFQHQWFRQQLPIEQSTLKKTKTRKNLRELRK